MICLSQNVSTDVTFRHSWAFLHIFSLYSAGERPYKVVF